MGTLRFGSAMMVLGILVGGAGAAVLNQPSVASAEAAMQMQMGARSAGDREMNAAMDGMNEKTMHMKLTGVQDRDFMLMMTPHHQSAVDMAKIELRRGTHPQLKAMAREIIESQDREIGQMRAWLEAWYGQKD